MNTNTAQISSQIGKRLEFQHISPSRSISSLEEDMRSSFLTHPRKLPPKYFYDEYGSQLFDQICDTPEYYQTRTEEALLREYAQNIIERVQPRHIVELGSGTSRKTRHLLNACDGQECLEVYVPFDVSKETLLDAGRSLVIEFDWLTVTALVGDYHGGFDNIPVVEDEGTRMFVFLGGTIGNFEHDDAIRFLSELREYMNPDDRLLLGADRVKDSQTLRAAYNDSGGVTAEFNLNVLNVLNKELSADFSPEKFTHDAIYNEKEQQIEMYLVSECEQHVCLESMRECINFKENERILTEISRKFTRHSLKSLLSEAGFCVMEHYEPDNEYFSLVLAKPDY